VFDPVKFLEREAARGDGALKLYARFGGLPARGFSFSQRTNAFEPGISVFNLASTTRAGIIDVDWSPLAVYDNNLSSLQADIAEDVWEAARALPPNAVGTIMRAEFLSRPAFLVTGPECKDRGCDGEPSLRFADLLATLDHVDAEYMTVPIDAGHPLARGRTEIRIAISARFRVSNRLFRGFQPHDPRYFPRERPERPSG